MTHCLDIAVINQSSASNEENSVSEETNVGRIKSTLWRRSSHYSFLYCCRHHSISNTDGDNHHNYVGDERYINTTFLLRCDPVYVLEPIGSMEVRNVLTTLFWLS